MKLRFSRAFLARMVKVLKWGKLLAKLTAIGTTVSGAVTAVMGSATTGIALSAAGATTYAATKGLPSQGYERTKHIPPGRVDKTANLLRQQQMQKKSHAGNKLKVSESPNKLYVGKGHAKHSSARMTGGGMLGTVRKNNS